MSVENQRRKELAAAFRWAARLNMHEAVANHFSMAISDDGQKFIVNRAGTHFSQATASGLVAVDTSLQGDSLDYGVDPTAWVLHSYLHRNVPHAKCVLHTHMPFSTALTLTSRRALDTTLSQNAMRFHGRVAVDAQYNGLALSHAEGERIAHAMNGADIAFLGNHGVVVCGPSIAYAYDDLYYLERACMVEVLAARSGAPLVPVNPALVDQVAKQLEGERMQADLFFEALRRTV